MILLVKNKMLDPKKSSKVLREDDKTAFIVRGRLIGSKKKIEDLDKNVLYKVKSKRFKLIHRGAYILDKNGEKFLKIVDNKFIKGFKIMDEFDEYRLEWGGWMSGVNKVYRNDELIGVITRKIRVVDTFEVSFDNEENAALLVAITIAIDGIFDKIYKFKKIK